MVAAMNQRAERIVVETERYRITGTLLLPRDGYRSRMSDFLNSTDRDYISLTDADVTSLKEPGEPRRRHFVAVSRRHIVMAMPDEDTDPDGT